MRTISLIALFLFMSASVFASQTTGRCEEDAVKRALATAPGIDPSSSASLVEIKLIKTDKKNATTSIEKYYVQTEDQGGTAASIISVEFKNLSSLSDEVFRFKCTVLSQKWVE